MAVARVGREGDELGEHGVVFGGDLPAFVDAVVFANAGAAGADEARDFAGRGEEAGLRVFGVDAALRARGRGG